MIRERTDSEKISYLIQQFALFRIKLSALEEWKERFQKCEFESINSLADSCDNLRERIESLEKHLPIGNINTIDRIDALEEKVSEILIKIGKIGNWFDNIRRRIESLESVVFNFEKKSRIEILKDVFFNLQSNLQDFLYIILMIG